MVDKTATSAENFTIVVIFIVNPFTWTCSKCRALPQALNYVILETTSNLKKDKCKLQALVLFSK
jgi:hypothetical protein